MYVVANMVFYTCGKLDIEKIKSLENLNELNIINFADIKLQNYWFNRFDKNNYKYIEFDFKDSKSIFKKNIDIDKTIEKLVLKIHLTGITSVEIYFKSSKDLETSFNRYLDNFIENYSKEIFDLVYDLNMKLSKQDFLTFSKSFRTFKR